MNKNRCAFTLWAVIIFSYSCPIHADETKDFKTYFNLANEQFKQNNIDQAINYYDKAITANPSCHQAYFNRGYAFEKKGDDKAAQKSYKKSLEVNPRYTRAHMMLGTNLKKEGKLLEACQEFRGALQSDPQNYDAHWELARALSDSRRFSASIHHFEQALKIKPDSIQCQLDYANTLNMTNRTEEALEWYKKLSEQIPESASLKYNIAYTLKKLGRVEQAFEFYDKALEINPNHVEGHFGKGVSLLMTENFKEGWKEYEWRWERDKNNRRSPNKPLWDGSDLNGKTIYLYAEQGLGDTFQFIRFAQIAKDKGGMVIVAVQSPLVKVLSSCPFIDRVISMNDPIPPCDVYAPIMSLPLILETEVETIPTDIPYIFAKENLIESWKEKLSSDTNFKIGICWQGNPNYSTPFLRNAVAAKSIELLEMADIARVPNVSLYCLQKTTGENQLKNLPDDFNLHVFGPDFDNKKINGRFMDTAAVMMNLDLIITVDTSIAHIAGGLGVPVWLMLPEPADWRWMLRKTDTPWYKNIRMFRQPKPDDWQTVINKIVQELTSKLEASKLENKNTQINYTITNPQEYIEAIISLKTTASRTTDFSRKKEIIKQLATLKKNMPAMTNMDDDFNNMINNIVRINKQLWKAHDKLSSLNPDDEKFVKIAQKTISLSILKDDLFSSAVAAVEECGA